VSVDDLIDFTPELRAEALEIVKRYKMGPLFTPPVVSKVEGPVGTLMLPSNTGGANWPGGALDPETNILYIYSFTNATSLGLVNDPKRSDMDFGRGRASQGATGATGAPTGATGATGAGGAGGGGEGGGNAVTVRGLPLIKPPYGRITAIDLNRGDIAWQVAHGDTPDTIRNHAALKGLTISRTGRTNGRIGTLVTKSLVIAGEPGFNTTPAGRGAMLRAYDKATGQDAGAVYMPAPQTGSPMTYMLNGRQYIVIAVGGSGYSAELLAYRLPAESTSDRK
jgi:quinoprotein glucose dehydrogenase